MAAGADCGGCSAAPAANMTEGDPKPGGGALDVAAPALEVAACTEPLKPDDGAACIESPEPGGGPLEGAATPPADTARAEPSNPGGGPLNVEALTPAGADWTCLPKPGGGGLPPTDPSDLAAVGGQVAVLSNPGGGVFLSGTGSPKPGGGVFLIRPTWEERLEAGSWAARECGMNGRALITVYGTDGLAAPELGV
jgi:hypothetical protein